jgi:hypothetical protein
MKVILIACLALLCIPAPQGTRLAEPPQEFVLQANGKECELRIGQPVELPKEFAGQKVTLRVRPTRLFDYQGLRFRYPQSYTFEYEANESGEQFVTLSGRSARLELQVYPDKMEAASLVEKLARANAEEIGARAKTSACELVGKEKRKLQGKRVQIFVGGQTSASEFYAVRLGGEVVAFVVREACGDDGKPDPEAAALLESLADSLEWPK